MPRRTPTADPEVAAVALLAEPTRRALYDWVIEQPQPVGREAAARALKIGRALATFHLDRLVDGGLLAADYRRINERRGPGAGRPARIYWRAERDISVTVPERRYGVAAELLAEALERHARPGADRATHAVGREFGRETGDRVRRSAARRTGSALLATALAEGGYRPTPAGPDGVIRLRNCPFDALVADYRPLVCSMNLGVAEGLVEGLGPTVKVRPVLDPQPGFCCVNSSRQSARPRGGGNRALARGGRVYGCPTRAGDSMTVVTVRPAKRPALLRDRWPMRAGSSGPVTRASPRAAMGGRRPSVAAIIDAGAFTRMHRTFWYFAAFAAVGTVFAATMVVAAIVLGGNEQPTAGSSGEPAPSAPTAEGPIGDITITAFDLGFEPTMVHVEAPGTYTVTFVNDGGMLSRRDVRRRHHDRGRGSPDRTGEVTIPAEGMGFICSVPGHADGGMRGEVMVAVAGGSGEPAPTDGERTAEEMRDIDAAVTAQFPAETEGRGNQLLEPEVQADGTLQWELTASVIEWETEPGTVVEAYAYNGMVPGPQLRAEVGDRIRIILNNELPVPTTIHWHGLFVPQRHGRRAGHHPAGGHAGRDVHLRVHRCATPARTCTTPTSSPRSRCRRACSAPSS